MIFKCFSIIHLSTVNFKEAARDLKVVVLVFGRLEIFEYIPGCQGVNSILRVLCLPVKFSSHRVSLARAGLEKYSILNVYLFVV